MIGIKDHQLFSLGPYKHDYPPLYVKEQPSYRYSWLVLTKVGLMSVATLALFGVTLVMVLYQIL